MIHTFHSPEAFKQFVLRSTQEQFQEALPKFSDSDSIETLIALRTKDALHPQEKLAYLIEMLEDSKTWEAIGRQLTVDQFLEILTILAAHPHFQRGLSLLLIGLQPQIFCTALNLLQNTQLELFKDKAVLEPLQYHLTQLVHQGESLFEQTNLQIEQLEQDLSTIDNRELTVQSLDILLSQIDRLRSQILVFLESVSAALSIAWNTERIDLIEKLSNINESLLWLLTQIIGHQGSENLLSSGIYLKIEQRFSVIYDSSLKDDDASIEGLTRLSIWHLKDYLELGLLPHINQVTELELDAAETKEHKRIEHYQRLTSLVQQQLERLQIGSVGDLKKKFLFSKPLLKAYIDKNQHLLNS